MVKFFVYFSYGYNVDSLLDNVVEVDGSEALRHTTAMHYSSLLVSKGWEVTLML